MSVLRAYVIVLQHLKCMCTPIDLVREDSVLFRISYLRVHYSSLQLSHGYFQDCEDSGVSRLVS